MLRGAHGRWASLGTKQGGRRGLHTHTILGNFPKKLAMYLLQGCCKYIASFLGIYQPIEWDNGRVGCKYIASFFGIYQPIEWNNGRVDCKYIASFWGST